MKIMSKAYGLFTIKKKINYIWLLNIEKNTVFLGILAAI